MFKWYKILHYKEIPPIYWMTLVYHALVTIEVNVTLVCDHLKSNNLINFSIRPDSEVIPNDMQLNWN